MDLSKAGAGRSAAAVDIVFDVFVVLILVEVIADMMSAEKFYQYGFSTRSAEQSVLTVGGVCGFGIQYRGGNLFVYQGLLRRFNSSYRWDRASQKKALQAHCGGRL